MTTVLRPAAAAPTVSDPPGPSRAARLRWSWRLMRRGTFLIWLAVAAYLTMEVLVFREAYPDAASRARLRDLSSSTAVRMMQGDPGAVDTAGGFAIWDGGWMLMLIVGSWAMLTITRLTRGEEDSGRVELTLSRPMTARQALTTHFAAMGVAAVGIAASVAVPFLVLGEPVVGSLLWGTGLGGFAAVATALGALVSQVAEPRRRVIQVGLGLVAAAYVLRVVANSAAHRTWALTVTPFGWVDELHAFSDNRGLWLAAPALAVLVLGGTAVVLCGRRDTGAALLRASSRGRSRLHQLGSATAFGWRLTFGALVAWTLTLAVVTLVFGLLTDALVDFINEDESYRQMLESMGMDMSDPVIGFLSYTALFLALPFGAFTGWRLGAARLEEAEGRLDNLLVRGVVRWRWLTVTTLYALLAASVLVVATGVALWAGAALVDAPVSAADVVEPVAGTMPVVVLFTGIAVLVFGVAPRLTTAVPVTLAVLAYLLETFGTLLSWPHAVLAVSPFHHLARLPSSPMSVTSIAVMTGTGVVAAVVGVVAFARRDVRGA